MGEEIKTIKLLTDCEFLANSYFYWIYILYET